MILFLIAFVLFAQKMKIQKPIPYNSYSNHTHRTMTAITKTAITKTTEADDLWLAIRVNYAMVLRSMQKPKMNEFYTTRFAGAYGGATYIDTNAERVICSLHDNAINVEHSVLSHKILSSLIAFHDPVVDRYIRAPSKTSIEIKMQYGILREQTYKILDAYNLSYLTGRL